MMNSKFSQLDEESLNAIKSYYPQDFEKRKGYVFSNGHLLPGIYVNEDKDISEFEIYDDDVWVCSFPKSVDKENLKKKSAEKFEEVVSPILYENLKKKNGSRFIKTHLPFDLLPKKLQRRDRKAKIIYVIRNPRDVFISYYHQRKGIGNLESTLEEFAELFLKDLINYGPYWSHILSYWNQRSNPAMKIIKFEDMKKDLPGVIHQVGSFLEKTPSQEEISVLCDHLAFDNMKGNPQVNGLPTVSATTEKYSLLRSGKVNQWKEAMNEELKAKFEKWEIANLKNTDFPLNYDI